ncbi:MAG: amidohydrolase family protein [Bacteroidetes bacterium]|nr:amidohydrolase family protein [Bacteroidota bacterium]
MKIRILFFITFFASHLFSLAQETFPVNGIRTKDKLYCAFTNAALIIDYRTIIPKGTLLIKDGIIEYAGPGVQIPEGAVVYDMSGQFIYPSFIDMYTSYGMSKTASAQKTKQQNRRGQQMESSRKGAYHWNQAVHPETEAHKLFSVDSAEAAEYRSLGFGSVVSFVPDGIARGSSVFVALGTGRENELVISEKATANYSFNKGSSTQDYPTSLMGSIALLRQTFLDAAWYKSNPVKKERNISLEAWNEIQTLPQVFEAGDKFNAIRSDAMGDEFNVQYIIKGGGNEYQLADAIRRTGATMIIPLNFPPSFDVSDPWDALQISLSELKHWELAPYNPGILWRKHVPFALTASDLKNKKDFIKNILNAVQYGLPADEALKALTGTPAKLLGMENKTGALKKGMFANFIITTDSLFTDDAVILENWVMGKQYVIEEGAAWKVQGIYQLEAGTGKWKLTVKISGTKSEIAVEDTASLKSTGQISFSGNMVTISFFPPSKKTDSLAARDLIRLSGYITYGESMRFSGRGELPDGTWIDWSAVRLSDLPAEKKKEPKTPVNTRPDTLVIYPFNSFGSRVIPAGETVLIKNATLWTNEAEGILEQTDLLIGNGKIISIGKNITPPPGSKTVNGTGKHVTPGIIDEHSHIAISGGVNESGQAVSAEVRIGDVIFSEDVNIYRQLAGGVTSSHLLHGSANPIGGQTALIKLRWGYEPARLKFEGVAPFIKFALGENVKQSNWGDEQTFRFPQTRMGVEQVMYDAFIKAVEYEKEWNKFKNLPLKEKTKEPPPRRDLELETLNEIRNGKRFITCHSYVQSEVNMMMHIADSMGFRVNTFTHILEGYKVAGKMKTHGAAASSFSDWWAYKFEVKDAIPYNGALLNKSGVLTAYNSDDADMARRLNQEAAKAVKYGGISEEDALKFVTLNPAKMLHVDDRVGSLKSGKDADMVIWSGNPLSVFSKPEKTFVDGICVYDAERDDVLMRYIAEERNRIIQKMAGAKKDGERVIKPGRKEELNYNCMDE